MEIFEGDSILRVLTPVGRGNVASGWADKQAERAIHLTGFRRRYAQTGSSQPKRAGEQINHLYHRADLRGINAAKVSRPAVGVWIWD